MKRCWFFHKWETVAKGKGEVTSSGLVTGFKLSTSQAVIEMQKCSRCKKERALIHDLNGGCQIADAEFFKDEMTNEENRPKKGDSVHPLDGTYVVPHGTISVSIEGSKITALTMGGTTVLKEYMSEVQRELEKREATDGKN